MNLEHIEAQRKQVVFKYRLIRTLVALPITFGFLYITFINNPSGLKVQDFDIIHYIMIPFLPLIGHFAGVGTAAWACNKDINEYIDIVYDNLTEDLYKKHFDNLQFRSSPLPYSDVYETELLKEGASFASSDNITGLYQGVPFKRSSIAIESSPKGEEGTTSTLFSGRWIQLSEMNFNVNKLYISKKNLKTSSKNDRWFKKSEYTKIRTDNNDFSDYYDVYIYSDSDRDFLTPSFIEKILQLDRKLKIGIHVTHKNAYIAIQSGRHNLSPSIFDSIYKEGIKNVEEDIAMIKNVIELFQ